LASVRCATPIAKVNVFLSAFASQRTDVPLCKRRTDFLYGSKGDNGKPNDNMLTHILSPYPQHKSALNDCVRLARSSFGAKKAILIYGFEHDAWPLEPAIEAFEHLANKSLSPVRYQLGTRYVSCFTGLTHHIHKKGKVFGWELIPNNTGNHDTGRPLTPR